MRSDQKQVNAVKEGMRLAIKPSDSKRPAWEYIVDLTSTITRGSIIAPTAYKEHSFAGQPAMLTRVCGSSFKILDLLKNDDDQYEAVVEIIEIKEEAPS